jgi:hypothetical protein
MPTQNLYKGLLCLKGNVTPKSEKLSFTEGNEGSEGTGEREPGYIEDLLRYLRILL